MEYMGEKHDCEEYADLTLEEFFNQSKEEGEGADIEAMLDDVPSKKTIDEYIEDAIDGEDVIDSVDLDDHMDDLIDGDAVDEMSEDEDEE